ncbi:MAG: ABC transporter substrate-binding protein [Betaproteobacteria bacterium]|nr:ABC transporter substrate-binding protein [Betaproteobacteria bacterium]MDE2003524.1 ABC transporter substrate-binding protein [Betaproteobacteria bacterium]MDE2208976.1 ABC transporter substrate-binding protein [Betaproteobacteria bacterium]MDE2360727.1 ABC transporter substrate-binding protein [Betaproteobacteria bacterium]
MKLDRIVATCAVVLATALGASAARAAANEVVIGDIDDMSGVYADVIGEGGVQAAKMAIADFGGSVLGKKIVFMDADHQNKPDVGAAKFRQWADEDGVNMILGGSNTGVNIAMSKVAALKKVPFISIGAAGASLTNEDCTPYTVHYAYDTTSLANGTATTIVKSGGKKWFFLTADYAFGTQLRDAASKVVIANGGTVVGEARVPLATSDFSSFLLTAQASGAQVLGLANAGGDFTNSLKAAQEFGIAKTMKPAALLAFISDINGLGLQAAQGLILTTGWYWDLNPETRAFAKRYFAVTKKEPTMNQAAYYSAVMHYLQAVKAVGSTDPDKVMAEMKKTKINDFFAKGGYIRPDGLMVHDMYVMQVKTPAESKYPWDYYKVLKVMPGEEAFGPMTGLCKYAK